MDRPASKKTPYQLCHTHGQEFAGIFRSKSQIPLSNIASESHNGDVDIRSFPSWCEIREQSCSLPIVNLQLDPCDVSIGIRLLAISRLEIVENWTFHSRTRGELLGRLLGKDGLSKTSDECCSMRRTVFCRCPFGWHNIPLFLRINADKSHTQSWWKSEHSIIQLR